MEGKKVGAIVIILLILGLGYYFVQGSAPGEGEDAVISIGFVGPLTGDAVSYGEPISNAVRMAVDTINQAGGVDGKMLKVIYEDGRCTNEDALSATQKLVNVDGVKMIIGGVCSGETFAMLSVTDAAGVIVISPSSSSPDLTGAGRYFFRNSPSDAEGGRQLAQIVTQEYKKVAIISEETDYAQGFARVFREYVPLLDGEVVADENFAPETSDFRSILTKIKAAEPEAIFVNPQTEIAGGTIVKQARELGITVPLFGSNVTGGTKSAEIAGDHIEGLVFVDAPGLRPSNPKANAFLEQYNARYGESGIPFYTAAAHDIVYLFAQAIEMVGSADDTEALRDYLSTMGNFAGVVGSYRFRPDGDPEGIGFISKKIENGEIVVVEE
ncbi:MAG: ABC transporter substrate-binding protein [Candidatus Kaiserbacteria bacterium]|nr:ABC transporter substrate-binding protein [Candidatus Kaiserbacteria bacterium]